MGPDLKAGKLHLGPMVLGRKSWVVAKALDVGCGRASGVKDDAKCSGLSNWEKGVASY